MENCTVMVARLAGLLVSRFSSITLYCDKKTQDETMDAYIKFVINDILPIIKNN